MRINEGREEISSRRVQIFRNVRRKIFVEQIYNSVKYRRVSHEQ